MDAKEIDDMIQHAGVKGMKWGVIKWRRASKGNSRKVSINKFHEKNKNKKSYKKLYNKNLKKTNGDHDKAAERTVRDSREKAIKLIVASLAVAKVAKMAATSPAAKRLGKNIILAAKRSPIRHVDGSKLTNIFDITVKTLM